MYYSRHRSSILLFFYSSILLLSSFSVLSQELFIETDTSNKFNVNQKGFISQIIDSTEVLDHKFVITENFLSNEGINQITFKNPITSELLTASAYRVKFKDQNNFTWTGKLEGEGEFITIARNPGGTIGMIKKNASFYFLHPVTPNISLFTETNPTYYSQFTCGLDIPPSGGTSQFTDDACSDECDEIIDALIVWTPESLEFLNAIGNFFISTLYATIGIESVNIAMQNSNVNSEIRFDAVVYGDFEFDDNNNIGLDADNLPLNQDIQNLRADFSADIVILMTNRPGYGPVSGIVSGIGPDTDNAFAIVQVNSLIAPRWTFAHEVGHLFGARHNRPNNGGNDDTDICAHGWRFDDIDDEERRTILALLGNQPNGRELHFSNPDVDFNGVQTGTDDDNNAGIISSGSCTITDFNPPAYLTAKIIGGKFLCTCRSIRVGRYTKFIYREHRNFAADVELANGPNPGIPPFTYEWFWNQSGVFTFSNPGTFIGSTATIQMTDTPCSSFFLYLRVTSSDGIVADNTKFVSTARCYQCTGCDITGRTSIAEDTNYKAKMNEILFPNPADNKIEFIFENKQKYEIMFSVLDITGKVIYSSKELYDIGVCKKQIQVAHLPSGVYYLVQNNQENITTRKFIKQ